MYFIIYFRRLNDMVYAIILSHMDQNSKLFFKMLVISGKSEQCRGKLDVFRGIFYFLKYLLLFLIFMLAVERFFDG